MAISKSAANKVRRKARYHHGELREALIRATRQLVERRGAENFTLADACRVAGVTTAAPYRHFRGKQEILEEIASRGFEELGNRTTAILAEKGEGTLEGIVAMRQAGQTLGHWRLLDCALVVTLEPCPMCAGAIVNARIPRLIYGCADPKAGAVRTLFQLCEDPRLNHRVDVIPGVLADDCASLLSDFFRAQRLLGKK